MGTVRALSVALLLVDQGHVATAVLVEGEQEETGAELERSCRVRQTLRDTWNKKKIYRAEEAFKNIWFVAGTVTLLKWVE